MSTKTVASTDRAYSFMRRLIIVTSTTVA